MEGLKQWLISLIFSAAAGALITVISPKGSNDKTLKTVVGIFIISSIFLPLTKMNISDFSLPAFANEFEIEQGEEGDFVIEMLEEELFETVSETAEEFNCEISGVEIDAGYDEDDCIIIQEIAVYYTSGETENIQMAAAETEKRLGVPVRVG